MDKEPASTPTPVNSAQTILVANQTVNVDGKVEWIQTLPTEKLEQFDLALKRATTRHGARVHATGFVVFGVWLLAFIGGNHWILAADQEASLLVRVTASALVPLPLVLYTWLIFADSRALNREAARAALRRWGEVRVEITLRKADELGAPPAIRAWEYIRRWSRSSAAKAKALSEKDE